MDALKFDNGQVVVVVVEDLPSDAKSDHTELWLSQDCADPIEDMLELIWPSLVMNR